LLPCGIDELLRAAGLSGSVAERGQQCWYNGTNGGLDFVAIEVKHRRNAPDHVGCQELHHE
jgi:hypothetical protein